MRIPIPLLLLFTLTGLLWTAGAQDAERWFYRSWTTEDGLPDNTISGIAQSKDGYLWVGTKGGLRRFNGADFAEIPLQRIPNLPSRAIREMHLDQGNRLWLSLERGPLLSLGEDASQLFTCEDGLPNSLIMGLTDDADRCLWIAYPFELFELRDGKISKLGRERGFEPFPGEPLLTRDSSGQGWLARGFHLGSLSQKGFQLELKAEASFTAIAPARGGGLWCGQGTTLTRYQAGQALVEEAQLDGKTQIKSLYEDRSGAVWLGTSATGLFHFKDHKLESVPTSHPNIQQITEDLEGNIWIATVGGGLQLVRPRTVSLLEQKTGFPFLSSQSTSQSPSGELWVVSAEGGVAKREAVSGEAPARWTVVSAQKDWTGGHANCVVCDPMGRVWIGTRDRGLLRWSESGWQQLTTADGLASNGIRSLHADREGTLWIATLVPKLLQALDGDKFRTLRHSERLTPIRAMSEGPDGTKHIATASGQLLRVDGERLVEEKAALTEKVAFSIRALHATADGSLWIGYAGDGLGRLKDGIYSRLTIEEGLQDNYISQIFSDGEGTLWLACNRGLSQIDLTQLIDACEGRTRKVRVRIFGRGDGLSSLQPSRDYSPGTCRGLAGELYFSMQSGLLEVDVPAIRDNPRPPAVKIEGIKLDDQLIAQPYAYSLLNLTPSPTVQNLGRKSEPLRLEPGHEKLEIQFAALSLASPENVHFRYRLKPFDQGWIEGETRRAALYPRLPAGKYQFQVIACNNVGVWNETGAKLDFTVTPFVWETWWFKIGGGLLTALLAGGIVFLGLQRRHRQQIRALSAKQQIDHERSRIARDLHDDLGASLTRITLLSRSEPDDSEESEQVLERIHTTAQDLIRSMEGVVWAVNPEHDTFDALANYLSNHGQSFLSLAGIRCRLDMPMELPERPLSTQIRHNLFLAFKEALNNTVKHSGASEVQISLVPGLNEFTLRLHDNGRGFDGENTPRASSTGGNGLANMQERMEEINGSCLIESTPEEGTVIEFRVPFRLRSTLR